MKNQKGFAHLILILIVAVVVAAGGFYLYTKQQGSVAVSPSPSATAKASATPSPSASVGIDLTADWKTYSYPQFGYSLKVPSEYSFNLGHPLPQENFILQEITYFPGTAVSGGGDVIVTVQSASSLQDGIKHLQLGGATTNEKQVTINDRQWTRFNLGVQNSETMYMIYVNNKLYTADGRNNDLVKEVVSTFQFTK